MHRKMDEKQRIDGMDKDSEKDVPCSSKDTKSFNAKVSGEDVINCDESHSVLTRILSDMNSLHGKPKNPPSVQHDSTISQISPAGRQANLKRSSVDMQLEESEDTPQQKYFRSANPSSKQANLKRSSLDMLLENSNHIHKPEDFKSDPDPLKVRRSSNSSSKHANLKRSSMDMQNLKDSGKHKHFKSDKNPPDTLSNSSSKQANLRRSSLGMQSGKSDDNIHKWKEDAPKRKDYSYSQQKNGDDNSSQSIPSRHTSDKSVSQLQDSNSTAQGKKPDEHFESKPAFETEIVPNKGCGELPHPSLPTFISPDDKKIPRFKHKKICIAQSRESNAATKKLSPKHPELFRNKENDAPVTNQSTGAYSEIMQCGDSTESSTKKKSLRSHKGDKNMKTESRKSRERSKNGVEKRHKSHEYPKKEDKKSHKSNEHGKKEDKKSHKSNEHDKKEDKKSHKSNEHDKKEGKRSQKSNEHDKKEDKKSRKSNERGKKEDKRSLKSNEHGKKEHKRSRKSREYDKNADKRSRKSREYDKNADKRSRKSHKSSNKEVEYDISVQEKVSPDSPREPENSVHDAVKLRIENAVETESVCNDVFPKNRSVDENESSEEIGEYMAKLLRIHGEKRPEPRVHQNLLNLPVLSHDHHDVSSEEAWSTNSPYESIRNPDEKQSKPQVHRSNLLNLPALSHDHQDVSSEEAWSTNSPCESIRSPNDTSSESSGQYLPVELPKEAVSSCSETSIRRPKQNWKSVSSHKVKIDSKTKNKSKMQQCSERSVSVAVKQNATKSLEGACNGINVLRDLPHVQVNSMPVDNMDIEDSENGTELSKNERDATKETDLVKCSSKNEIPTICVSIEMGRAPHKPGSNVNHSITKYVVSADHLEKVEYQIEDDTENRSKKFEHKIKEGSNSISLNRKENVYNTNSVENIVRRESIPEISSGTIDNPNKSRKPEGYAASKTEIHCPTLTDDVSNCVTSKEPRSDDTVEIRETDTKLGPVPITAEVSSDTVKKQKNNIESTVQSETPEIEILYSSVCKSFTKTSSQLEKTTQRQKDVAEIKSEEHLAGAFKSDSIKEENLKLEYEAVESETKISEIEHLSADQNSKLPLQGVVPLFLQKSATQIKSEDNQTGSLSYDALSERSLGAICGLINSSNDEASAILDNIDKVIAARKFIISEDKDVAMYDLLSKSLPVVAGSSDMGKVEKFKLGHEKNTENREKVHEYINVCQECGDFKKCHVRCKSMIGPERYQTVDQQLTFNGKIGQVDSTQQNCAFSSANKSDTQGVSTVSSFSCWKEPYINENAAPAISGEIKKTTAAEHCQVPDQQELGHLHPDVELRLKRYLQSYKIQPQAFKQSENPLPVNSSSLLTREVDTTGTSQLPDKSVAPINNVFTQYTSGANFTNERVQGYNVGTALEAAAPHSSKTYQPTGNEHRKPVPVLAQILNIPNHTVAPHFKETDISLKKHVESNRLISNSVVMSKGNPSHQNNEVNQLSGKSVAPVNSNNVITQATLGVYFANERDQKYNFGTAPEVAVPYSSEAYQLTTNNELRKTISVTAPTLNNPKHTESAISSNKHAGPNQQISNSVAYNPIRHLQNISQQTFNNPNYTLSPQFRQAAKPSNQHRNFNQQFSVSTVPNHHNSMVITQPSHNNLISTQNAISSCHSTPEVNLQGQSIAVRSCFGPKSDRSLYQLQQNQTDAFQSNQSPFNNQLSNSSSVHQNTSSWSQNSHYSNSIGFNNPNYTNNANVDTQRQLMSQHVNTLPMTNPRATNEYFGYQTQRNNNVALTANYSGNYQSYGWCQSQKHLNYQNVSPQMFGHANNQNDFPQMYGN